MADQETFDAFHHHEALHTVSVFADMFEKHVRGHGFIQSDAALKGAAERISIELGAFYQLVGVGRAGGVEG